MRLRRCSTVAPLRAPVAPVMTIMCCRPCVIDDMPITLSRETMCCQDSVIIVNVNGPNPVSSRERTRAQLVEVAAHVLATEGPDAVTTRSVALAAGVQAPTIYRLFGDKNGLLDAVVEHGFASYAGQKHLDPDADPVESLHAGWELHVGFGLANPELFRLMHAALRTPDDRAVAATGMGVLQARVHQVAEAGRLRVTERRAVALIIAAGTGVVFTLIEQAEDERDDTLADTAWESVCATILTD